MEVDAVERPDWYVSRQAHSPVVVVAPHGGLRTRSIRRTDGMNDLHTADLALEIAERLDAHALVNRGCDRNDIDLNRIRQLVAKAPFFLAALRARVASVVERGERPLVLLVHGWNMAVPWCDVGVGIRERADLLYGRFPTVGRDRYESFVRPLARRLFDAGLGASIGLRYPAAGKDNATQLFSGRHTGHDHEDVATLAALGAEGRVDAVQLELGIPLRWPGWRREAFVDALVATVQEEKSPVRSAIPISPAGDDAGSVATDGAAATFARSAAWGLEPKPPRAPVDVDRGCSIQAALPDATGVFMGAEPTGASTMATRVCLALPDGSMLLFVGEGPWDGRAGRYRVAGFEWEATAVAGESAPRAVHVRLAGPLVHYSSHDAFVDLEKGLSSSSVAEAEIELQYTAVDANYGELQGRVCVGGVVDRSIAVWAICQRGGRRSMPVGDRLDVYLTGDESPPRRLFDSGEAPAAIDQVFFSGDREASRIEVRRAGATILRGETPVRVPVYRPLPDGRVVCVTFGTVRTSRPGMAPGIGVYERVEILGTPPMGTS